MLLRRGKIEFYLICSQLTSARSKFSKYGGEVGMRILIVVFAAFLALGLVKFGVIAAQKITDPVPLTTATVRLPPPDNNVPMAVKSDKTPLHLAGVTSAAPPLASTVSQNNSIAPTFHP